VPKGLRPALLRSRRRALPDIRSGPSGAAEAVPLNRRHISEHARGKPMAAPGTLTRVWAGCGSRSRGLRDRTRVAAILRTQSSEGRLGIPSQNPAQQPPLRQLRYQPAVGSLRMLLAPARTGAAHVICFGAVHLRRRQGAVPIHDGPPGTRRGGRNACAH
jgi:hypothetical protein